MKGIKESLELVEGLEILALAVIDIAKDGIGPDDLPKALDLIKKSDKIMEAVKGLDALGEEFKDIDQAELIQVGSAVFITVKKILEASKKKVEA